MFVWWYIRLIGMYIIIWINLSAIFIIQKIGCLCVGIIHCQDNIPVLADIEPHPDSDVHIDLSINDNPPQPVNYANNLAENGDIPPKFISTTIQTPEPFSCHECTNCISKSDFISRVCEAGITMCYVYLFFISLMIYSFISFSFFLFYRKCINVLIILLK